MNPSLFSSLRWRLLGPWRGGKATAVVGLTDRPAVFYMGTDSSGVWKTDDAGRTWRNITDPERLTGIGALAAAGPNLLYVAVDRSLGSAGPEGLYRYTWRQLGGALSASGRTLPAIEARTPSDHRERPGQKVASLREGRAGARAAPGPAERQAGGVAAPRQAPRQSIDAGAHLALVALRGHPVFKVWLDPHNTQLVLAASSEGISRSSDGGNTWTLALSAKTVGGEAVALESAPDAPATIYAAFHTGRAGLFPSARIATLPIYRSTDAGRTWSAVAGTGLPPDARGRVSLAVAPGTHGQRVYAYMAQGVFRSDDAGAHWRLASNDPRLVGGGQFFHIYVDPADANVLYAMETAVYRSTDAGATWQAFQGAPSGDDFNAMWIDPTGSRRMALAVDQGTEISLNAGRTWSTWYNQPTGQMYNVSTDDQFPFHLYASQQDSGTVAVPIRANDGQITYRDWWTTNGFESAVITPDPLHPNIVFATGWFGSVIRTDHVTGQSVHVFERNPKYREARFMPMVFLPGDLHTLLLGTQYVLATSDAGDHWKAISPDLTSGKGAITAIAPSPVNPNAIWVGTSNGLIQLTTDNGRIWHDVTPKGFKGYITMIEPGQRKAGVAFVVASGTAYYTSDNGSNWRPISATIPGRVNAIRQDATNHNLLFAAADAGVFAYFDNSSNWQSLQLNLPASRVTDLQLRHNHLVISTYGRGLWSLDDIASLRQLSPNVARSTAHLFRPSPAIRLQWDDYTDTPLNPDEPHSKNPPDGAIIDYYLKSPAVQPLTLQIYDSQGHLINSYSSVGPDKTLAAAWRSPERQRADPAGNRSPHSKRPAGATRAISGEPPYVVNVAGYWLAPPTLLPNHAGINRFVWNLRYPDPPHILFTYFGFQRDYFEYTLADHAIPHNTPWHEPQGPMVVPGIYKLVLTVAGQRYTEPLTVKLDPRLANVTQADLVHQLAVAQSLADGLQLSTHAYQAASAASPDQSVDALKKTFGHLNLRQARLLSGVTQADAAPGAEVTETVHGLCSQYNSAVASWNELPKQVAVPQPKLTPQHCGLESLNQK
ncbi:MAG: hypothetical protein EPN33_08265 [Acidobacteria bacterium]|nr:MAG: hypothetical protein EPN33_08265 [Acidobacteriota bacterium]